MANTVLWPNKGNVMHVAVVFGLVLLLQRAGATEFKVGGVNGWRVIDDPNSPSYNQWAEKNRFQVGDSLAFVYLPEKDSVSQVNIDDYTSCNTASPLATFTDGNTLFKFSESGPYYFISGNKDNCLKNEKIHVIIMANRSNQSSKTSEVYPPPPDGSLVTPPSPPLGSLIPPPSPLGSLATPPPPPLGSMATPLPPGLLETPPPPGSLDIVPAPAPIGEESPSTPALPPNGASTLLLSAIGSFGALVGSSFLFLI